MTRCLKPDRSGDTESMEYVPPTIPQVEVVSAEQVIEHPFVEDYRIAQSDRVMVIALRLRPVFSRKERMDVMLQVARSVAAACPVTVYVCADLDIWQAIKNNTMSVETMVDILDDREGNVCQHAK